MENTNENVNVVNTEKTIIKEVQVPVEVIKEVEVIREVINEVPAKIVIGETISKALVKFNLEMENITKNKKNDFFKSNYLDLSAIMEVIRPLLAKNGLSIVQYPVNDKEGRISVNTILVHENGEQIEFKGVQTKPEKMGNVQSMASCISYLRRYEILCICGVAADDDDGNAASGNKEQQSTNQSTTTTQTQTTPKPTGRIGRI